MNRFVFVCLLVMAWGYWELSGGADFVPEERPVIAEVETAPAPAPLVEESAEVPEPVETPVPSDPTPEAPPAAAVAPPEEPIEEPIEDLTPEAEDPQFQSLVQDAVAEALPSEAPAESVDLTPAEPADLPAEPAEPVDLPAADLRVVTGSLVNLRDGPGTGFAAVDQLPEGTVTEVIESGDGGWVHIQVQGSDVSGWMSGDFLAPLNG